MFCPKCRSILRPKKDEDGKTILYCSCGYSSDKTAQMKTIKEKQVDDKAEMGVVDKEIETLPISEDEICPKCGNKRAYYWLIQTRAGDEPETKFLRCTKCKHTWRDYS